MRVTMHNGRFSHRGAYSAKHNDRNFDIKKADHIDESRQELNVKWNLYGDGVTFEECELQFYEENFRAYLDDRNAKYVKRRQHKMIQSMKDYHKAKNSMPEETIFQIGCKEETVDRSVLEEVVREQLEWEQKQFPQAVILNWSLHADEEGAPHVHVRKVWIGHEKGAANVSQNAALREMGIERPDLSRGEKNNNNRKMTFTRLCREHLLELCAQRGLEIETEPKERSQTGLTLIEFKARKEEAKLKDLKHENECLDLKNSKLYDEYTMKQTILDGMSKQIALGEREKDRYLIEMNTMEKRIEEKYREYNVINQKVKRAMEEEKGTIGLVDKIDSLTKENEKLTQENEMFKAYLDHRNAMEDFEDWAEDYKRAMETEQEEISYNYAAFDIFER